MMSKDVKDCLKRLAQRYPSVLEREVNATLPPLGDHPPPEPEDSDAPSWCTCHHCRDMPMPEERKCCRKLPDRCRSMSDVSTTICKIWKNLKLRKLKNEQRNTEVFFKNIFCKLTIISIIKILQCLMNYKIKF